MSVGISDRNSPLVTVLLPVHNGSLYVKLAIESILEQTFTDFELLIIDDGSTDSSASIVCSISDPRIHFIQNERNLGLIATLNKGISIAKGKYIARMDADDFALPGRLKLQVQRMESDAGIAVCATHVELINEDGERTGVWSTDMETNTENEIRNMMQKTNCIAHPTILIRKDIAEKFNYKENQKGAEDWDLWMRILASGNRIVKIQEVLLQYRVHPASTMSISKATETLEIRLMRVKWKFIWGQFLKLRINGFYFGVKFSYTRNLVRNIISNKLPYWGKDIKRYLTSPPWKVFAEGKKFAQLLESYSGRHFFVFPYTHVGGAEKVHASIINAIASEKPIVIFSGFSDNTKFLNRYSSSATILDVAHFVNYPLTRKKAKRLLAEKVNATQQAVFFGCNAGFFYDLIPLLNLKVKVMDLIHAFKFQPGANLSHLKYLALASRIDKRIFVSGAAMEEFSKFEFANNIPKRLRNRLTLISNGVTDVHSEIVPLHALKGVLFVGRNSPEKRMDIFLQVAKRLNNKFHFTVIGTTDPGTNPEVKFAGEITDEAQIQSIYQANDFLLLTSAREGFPMVVMEAMMNGLVVIATPVGDIPNHLNGENGRVTKSVETNLVFDEMVELLENLIQSPEKILAMKNAAREYAMEYFSEAKFISNYRKLLLD